MRTHLENIYERLHVSSRTAAVTRAFPDRVALPGSISARSGRSPIAGPGHAAESRA